MYQVSVEYVKGYGEKSGKNHRWDGLTDRWRANFKSSPVNKLPDGCWLASSF